MSQRHRDPLDSGDPQVKAWEEFRATFSSCLLQVWLLDELDELAPGYFADLESRLFVGLANADALAELEDDYDGAVPLESPSAKSVWFMDRKEADELFDQLFPHGVRASGDKSEAYGLAIVGFHSALAAYCAQVGVKDDRKLPHAILAYLRSASPPRDLDALTADLLTEFHETRRIFVHQRGTIDSRYINAVKDNRLVEGEPKRISFERALIYARAVWRVSKLLRETWRGG